MVKLAIPLKPLNHAEDVTHGGITGIEFKDFNFVT